MRVGRTALVCAAVLFAGAVLTIGAAQNAGNAGAPQGPPRGGGRGGPSPGQLFYTARCASCHGPADSRAGGSAKTLFDQKWSYVLDDALRMSMLTGTHHTQAGIAPGLFTDDELFQVVTFIRTQSGALIPKPEFVADANGQVINSEKQSFKIEVLTKELETPWGLAFLPDGRLLVTERPGRLRIYDKGKLSEPVKGAPTPHVQQDGGYLDVTVHPQYARNGWIYLSYSEVQPGFVPPPASETPPAAAPVAPPAGAAAGQPGAGPGAGGAARGQGRGRGPQIPSNTVIVRGKINASNEWTDQQVIFRSPSELYVASGVHFGSRFLWDKQNHLFFTLGERGTMQNAQDLKNPLGKIHRINDDGSIPKDNPFANKPDALGSVWSYGHRNPQGLAWDPATGRLWESEHGPGGGDEINVIDPGKNYGWGVISMGSQPGITERSHAGMEQPVVYFTPSIGPSAITFYAGSRYPGWKNSSLFVCALIGQQLRRLEVKDNKVTHQEMVFGQFGRVHGIVTGPDGYFYVALQNPTAGATGITMSASTPGQLVRLIPVTK
jgi:aldose sugar dehydrogenase